MLRTLSLRDFAIVVALELDIDRGFTVLTGETGAGKSILIDALALLLGDRADANAVRDGAARAELHASFEATGPAKAWLSERALIDDDAPAETDILLRRTIDTSGKSRAWINGTPATLADLKALGECLVDIHGQHQHQLLLRANAQKDLLDAQAGLTPLAREVSTLWRSVQKAQTELRDLETLQTQKLAEQDRLHWIFDELDRLRPQVGEWEEIEQEHRRLSHAASLIAGAQGAVDTLSEGDDNLQSRLSPWIHRLESLAEVDPQLAAAADALNGAMIQLNDAASALNAYLARAELDPERLALVDARMDALHAAARRFRVEPEALPALLDNTRQQLDALSAGLDASQLQARLDAALKHHHDRASQLSLSRAEAAKSLSEQVTEQMQRLGMNGGRFEVALPPEPPGANGLESVEFRVAGHSGAVPRALAKVASGGELSRISLALAVIAAEQTPIPTLIFDEVDSGVGGAVGLTVGQLLRQLGQNRQVLCVTHLGQVAAFGHQHLCVSKSTQTDGSTRSEIRLLSTDDRITELARMLGGNADSAVGRQHAQELLNAAH